MRASMMPDAKRHNARKDAMLGERSGCPQPGASPAKALLGLGMVFCLPSVLVSLLFYLYLAQAPVEGKVAYGSFYDMGLMAVLVAFAAGLSMVYHYWAEQLSKLYQRRQLWASSWLVPMLFLGPLYYHLAVLLIAFKRRQRRAAYWSFLGVLAGCGQWLALIWGLSGALGISFQIGFWFSLCGIAAYVAATQALTQMLDADSIGRRAIALSWALTLSWFALQAWHCILILDAEQRQASEQLQLASAYGHDLVRSRLNSDSASDESAASFAALGEILGELDPAALAALDDAQPAEFGEQTLAEATQREQWLEEHAALLARLAELNDALPLQLGVDYGNASLAEIYAQESSAWMHLWQVAGIYRLQMASALQAGDGARLLAALRRQAWLRDSATAVPNMTFYHAALLLEGPRLTAIKAALAQGILDERAQGALKNELLAAAARQPELRRRVLLRDALDMLSAVEYLSFSPLARRQAINTVGAIGGISRFGRYMPGFQAMGALLCNPIHWAMQRDLAWYFARQRQLLTELAANVDAGANAFAALRIDDTPGYAYLSAYMLSQHALMLDLDATAAANRRECIAKLK
jgi:hypothetical protein